MSSLEKEKNNLKRYIISTYVVGCNVNERFLNSMKNFARKQRAEIILIPTNVNQLNEEEQENIYILRQNRHLNRNLLISLLPLSPDQIDPLTGLERLSKNQKSVVYASPKQRLKSIPSPSETLPRVMMTPGAMTHPTTKLTKRGLISNRDHIYGAVVVEVQGKSIFHFRQVQADKDGSFIDLGKQYNSDNSTEEAKLEALIPGDYHCGFTDQHVKTAILKVLTKYKPKHLILHDFFDGISINHHIEKNILTKAKFGDMNDLTKEVEFAAKELEELAGKVKNVVIVKSNHDEFLDRWLNEGKYVTDVRNHIIGLELALAKANGSDPLEYALKAYGNKTLTNVKYLKSDESFRVSKKKIECGAHGHLGANGARGSAVSLEKCYKDIVYGHSHSPQILRGAWVMGTSTHLRLGYNSGPSSWMQTMCLVYENGARQLINVIKGNCVV